MTLLAVKNIIMTSLDLDTIRHKKDQDPEQQSKKHIQKSLQKQSRGIGRYTRKITETLLHREDSNFKINN
jgi:transposase